jgi:hypothetical protein
MFLKSIKIYETMTIFDFFLNYMGKMGRAGAGVEIFDKRELEPEPHKKGPAPKHCQPLF